MIELLRIHALVRMARLLLFVGLRRKGPARRVGAGLSESWTRQKHGQMRGMRPGYRGRRREGAQQKPPVWCPVRSGALLIPLGRTKLECVKQLAAAHWLAGFRRPRKKNGACTSGVISACLSFSQLVSRRHPLQTQRPSPRVPRGQRWRCAPADPRLAQAGRSRSSRHLRRPLDPGLPVSGLCERLGTALGSFPLAFRAYAVATC